MQVTDIVEEHNTRHTIWLSRLAQERAHRRLVPTWLTSHRGTQPIVFIAEKLAPLGRRGSGIVRCAGNYHARGFPCRMGIDDLDYFYTLTHVNGTK